MNIRLPEGQELLGLGAINVILGRNGSGKSRLLRQLDEYCRQQTGQFGLVKYVTPERGGEWQLDSSIEQSLRSSPTWADDVRRVNRFEQYRQTAIAELAALEIGYFRRVEAQRLAGENVEINFASVLQKINNLLENVEVVRPDEGAGNQQRFPVRLKQGETPRRVGFMSSGESELVALGCDIVSFSHRARSQPWTDRTNMLLIDEPDVHLHPDLQYRLMSLLMNELALTSPRHTRRSLEPRIGRPRTS